MKALQLPEAVRVLNYIATFVTEINSLKGSPYGTETIEVIARNWDSEMIITKRTGPNHLAAMLSAVRYQITRFPKKTKKRRKK